MLQGALRSQHARDFLENLVKENKWRFGVHIQGDCSYLKSWPLESWQSFFMWPDPNASFLSNISPKMIFPMGCSHFMPTITSAEKTVEKYWDICVISRASRIKRISETLAILKNLLASNPEFKAVLVVPDPRVIEEGEKTYEMRDIDRRFFDEPREMFKTSELKRLSFICSSTRSFGQFPISSYLIHDLIRKSKFLMLTSPKEGTPRVFVEAWMAGTPCIAQKTLKSGLNSYIDESNTLLIDEDTELASQQIAKALQNQTQYSVDSKKFNLLFGEDINREKFKTFLSEIIHSSGCPVEGEWCLDDLVLRLPGHGNKFNFQLLTDLKTIIDWINYVDCFDPYDEDQMLATLKLREPKVFAKSFFSRTVKRIINKISFKIWEAKRVRQSSARTN